MNCFEVLGIEETGEVKKIKRAYAAKTREFHPEEYPEEFKMLHDAYEEALFRARQEKVQAQEENTAIPPYEEERIPAEKVPQNEDSEWKEAFAQIAGAAEKGSVIWSVRRIMEDCRNLYLNETERGKLYHWKDLFEEPQYVEIFRTKEFIAAWYEFLESHHLFPYRIWMYFSSQDGLRFSGESYGIKRFPYEAHMEQTRAEAMYYGTAELKGGQTQGAAHTSRKSGGRNGLSPAVKAVIYAAALAGAVIGGGVLGLIAGLIFG